MISHYNNLKLFEDEVDGKVKKCETLNEGRIC